MVNIGEEKREPGRVAVKIAAGTKKTIAEDEEEEEEDEEEDEEEEDEEDEEEKEVDLEIDVGILQ
jgi:ribosomal protein L12E/L44/L45/RPP1/RPP2